MIGFKQLPKKSSQVVLQNVDVNKNSDIPAFLEENKCSGINKLRLQGIFLTLFEIISLKDCIK